MLTRLSIIDSKASLFEMLLIYNKSVRKLNIIRNSFWNVGGFIIPSLIAIPAMGLMSRLLGLELFGLFTIFFSIFGFASILDAGLSRTIIREVSIFRNDKQELERILSTTLVIVLVISTLGVVALFLCARNLANVFNVSDNHLNDVILSLRIISLSFPFLLLSQIFMGYLEGLENFKLINLQKTVTGSLLAFLPLAMILIKPTLYYAIAGLALARVLSFVINYFCIKGYAKVTFVSFDSKICKRMLSYGGWVSVSNIISPLILYCDRFIISHITGAKNVAFYTAPSEVVNRVSIFPNAISRVLFPIFSFSLNNGDSKKQLKHGYLLVGGVAFLILVPIFVFSEFILKIWVGNEYGAESALILRVLLIGMFFNSIAQVTFSEIQARGYSRVTAIIHLIELIPYFLILYLLIDKLGLVGAAYASTFRVILDLVLLLLFKWKMKHEKN